MSWALYTKVFMLFFRVRINEITKWKIRAEKNSSSRKKFLPILKAPRDQMAKATSTSWVSVSFTRPSSGAYAFLAKLYETVTLECSMGSSKTHLPSLNHLSMCFANWSFLTRSNKIIRMIRNDCSQMSTLVEPNKNQERVLTFPSLPASISNLSEWPTKLH